jgi:hypothetical protein
MTDLLFDPPWWLATLLIGAGVVLFWNGNRRQETRVRNIGMALVGAAAALLALAYFVDTPLERAVKDTKRLVRAVEATDWNTMRAILDPRTSVSVMNMPIYDDRDEIITGAKMAVDRYGVKNIRFLSTDAERADTLITITMTLLSEHESIGGRTINTTWQIEWQQSGDTWSMVRIICQKIGNMTGESAGAQFPKP